MFRFGRRDYRTDWTPDDTTVALLAGWLGAIPKPHLLDVLVRRQQARQLQVAHYREACGVGERIPFVSMPEEQFEPALEPTEVDAFATHSLTAVDLPLPCLRGRRPAG